MPRQPQGQQRPRVHTSPHFLTPVQVGPSQAVQMPRQPQGQQRPRVTEARLLGPLKSTPGQSGVTPTGGGCTAGCTAGCTPAAPLATGGRRGGGETEPRRGAVVELGPGSDLSGGASACEGVGGKCEGGASRWPSQVCGRPPPSPPTRSLLCCRKVQCQSVWGRLVAACSCCLMGVHRKEAYKEGGGRGAHAHFIITATSSLLLWGGRQDWEERMGFWGGPLGGSRAKKVLIWRAGEGRRRMEDRAGQGSSSGGGQM